MSKTGHTPYGEVPLDAEVGMDAPRARGQRQRATPEQRAPPEPNPPSEPAPPDANEAVRRAQRRFREVKQAGVAVHQLLPSPIAEESASAGKGARERGLDTKEQEIASKYMRGVPAFTQLSLNGLQQVVQKLRVVKFAPKEVIINKGDTGKEFFMIKDGCVEFTKGLSEGADDLLGKRTEGEFFGEIALIADDNRATANATASGRGAECFALNKPISIRITPTSDKSINHVIFIVKIACPIFLILHNLQKFSKIDRFLAKPPNLVEFYLPAQREL